jgi:alkylhydroperoxidase family enzyme
LAGEDRLGGMGATMSASWLRAEAQGTMAFERALSLSPRVYERFLDMYRQLWCPPVADPVLLELARLRIAQLLRSDGDLRLRFKPAVQAGLDEAKIAEIRHWPTSGRFSEVERAVLAFTEQFVIDAHAMGDEQCAAVTTALDRRSVAGLTMAVAVFEATTRLRLGLGVSEPTDEVLVFDPAVDALP